jgi:hypothetical protein
MIVQQCIDKGLVRGKRQIIDSTHIVADMAKYCCMRRCRYRGLARAGIHTLLAAIASNVKRMARLCCTGRKKGRLWSWWPRNNQARGRSEQRHYMDSDFLQNDDDAHLNVLYNFIASPSLIKRGLGGSSIPHHSDGLETHLHLMTRHCEESKTTWQSRHSNTRFFTAFRMTAHESWIARSSRAMTRRSGWARGLTRLKHELKLDPPSF